ncbi:CheR family methyltransferase [Vogesella urethralis]|uniref:CheR family methyltransferase n=1 Tax=Vogesella urethralis TaxID=2592656 RepID=UPI001F0ECDC4|nr:CheR family methyltransferase [Vogesella urethralis]MEC5206641.1 chemotaxis protein methyltransferase CheR [Vogesella perlucida]
MGGILSTASDQDSIFERDLHFTDEDFRIVRELLYDKTGIALTAVKNHMAYARLAKHVRRLGVRRFSDYLAMLRSEEGAHEWEHFINALTTNLTSFFREAHHFDMLRQHAQRHAVSGEPYRVWSSASSTGEEPYSIAMTLDPVLRAAPYQIIASDIDTHVLQKAASGVYALERIAKLSDSQLKQFFLRGKGANEGMVKIKSGLMRHLEFRQINLVDRSWPAIGQFDVIFCRNVLIYFDKPTQAGILEHFAQYLKPHGLLLLGHSENIQHITETFTPCGKTAYRLANGKAP